MVRTLLALALVLATAAVARASSQKLDVAVRGQTLTVALYPAQGSTKGSIVIGSGDVGWVGLAVTVAEDFSAAGYAVVGINVRQYLAAYTAGKSHLRMCRGTIGWSSNRRGRGCPCPDRWCWPACRKGRASRCSWRPTRRTMTGSTA
jgi:hypothetical protein